MNDRLHEVIAQCAVIHEHNLKENIIFDLDAIESYLELEKTEEDIKEHYYKLLMQYYFQNNFLDGLQKLLLDGIRFDLRFDDIAKAFCSIKEDEDNVIEFFEDSVVFLKDELKHEYLEQIYQYFQTHEKYQHYLEPALEIIKRNRYICAYAYKLKDDEFKEFFINNDLLESLERDLPFVLK